MSEEEMGDELLDSASDSDTGDSNLPADNGKLLVNAQIVDAVKQTRDAVHIGPDDKAKVVDSGVAYQKASQAAAFAVQDATDYLRNIMAISSTAQGMALKLFLETKDPTYVQIITQAQAAVTMAASNLETVGVSAISVATDFPR